ncbi:unnamed protein product [Polarella glacialis]|uniref:Uncharacterized protein n=1 Tax=Polarella glacialis TaxID=89957 RepID=A0A813K9D7_POLGL|nr:unnamed protein product [Polarella glacialis]
MDPGASLINSPVFHFSDPVQRGLIVRSLVSGDPIQRHRVALPALPEVRTMQHSRSTPSVANTENLGLSSSLALGPKFRAPHGAISGSGHPSLNGTWGFSKFYTPTGSAWLK